MAAKKKQIPGKIHKITLGLVLSWLFGILFVIFGLAVVAQGLQIAGILMILFSVMILPPFNKFSAKKFHFEISKGLKVGLAILVLILWCYAVYGPVSENTSTLSTKEAVLSLSQIKQQAITVSYDELYRHNEDYVGTIIHFRGELIQVIGSNAPYDLRVATKEDYFGTYSDEIIYVSNYKENRLLENDIIDVWGEVTGLETYEAIMGNSVTIPKVEALHIELVQKAT